MQLLSVTGPEQVIADNTAHDNGGEPAVPAVDEETAAGVDDTAWAGPAMGPSQQRAQGELTSEDEMAASMTPDEADARRAQVLAFALNMCVLWSYQSLLSAQDLYEAKWPEAHLSFVGTAACSAAMCAGQAVQMATGFDERTGYTVRIVPGFLCFSVIGCIILATPTALTIILAFAATGVLNVLTEAVLYSMAGHCWPDERLTSSLNSGNGAAGAINVLLLALIRAGTSSAAEPSTLADSVEALEVANRVFLGVMVTVNLVAVWVYFELLRIPAVAARALERRMRNRALKRSRSHERAAMRPGVTTASTTLAWRRQEGPKAFSPSHAVDAAALSQRRDSAPPPWGYPARPPLPSTYAQVWPRVRLAVVSQVLVFVITLAVWPGVACATTPTGWFARHPTWFCSPLVIGLYNVADLAGRLLAGHPRAVLALPLAVCARLALARCILVIPLVLAAKPIVYKSTPAVSIVVVLVGVSNGLLATRTMCLGPEQVLPHERGTAAGIMVLALYWGIGLGAALGLLYSQTLLS